MGAAETEEQKKWRGRRLTVEMSGEVTVEMVVGVESAMTEEYNGMGVGDMDVVKDFSILTTIRLVRPRLQ